MLVTFTTDQHANVTLFGDIAITLLAMMGHSGTVPGAIQADDVHAALNKLTSAINNAEKTSHATGHADDKNKPVVSMKNRALPLIDLLETAVKTKSHVMWTGNQGI